MARLVGADRAFIDPAKIADYLLDPTHRVGRHKARVFASVLGLGANDAAELVSALKAAVLTRDAEPAESDQHGARYVIEFTFERLSRSAVMRSAWMVRTGEDFPRFVTAYVAKQETDDE